jgi:RNA polymerase II subunit A-like phosphatase
LATPSDEANTKQDRRDSIDMPTFEGAKLPLRNADTIKDAEMEGTASVVSDDLELSDDNGSNSGISSNTSSNENGRNNDVAKSVEIINDHPFKSIAKVKIPDQSQDTSKKSLYLGKPINKSSIPGDCNEGNSTTGIANDERKSIIDESKDTVSAATTEDSDSSAKSGMENDGDEFNLKKEGDKADKSSTEIEDDLFLIEDTDDYLLYLEDTLKNIHKAYYEAYDRRQGSGKIPDLKDVIPSVKRVSLKGTSIVFSGVIPTNIPVERSKPYLVARSLGAEVTERITRKTTHLVAARTGTAKVNEAKKRAKNVHLVTPDWLWCCAERW